MTQQGISRPARVRVGLEDLTINESNCVRMTLLLRYGAGRLELEEKGRYVDVQPEHGERPVDVLQYRNDSLLFVRGTPST